MKKSRFSDEQIVKMLLSLGVRIVVMSIDLNH